MISLILDIFIDFVKLIGDRLLEKYIGLHVPMLKCSPLELNHCAKECISFCMVTLSMTETILNHQRT